MERAASLFEDTGTLAVVDGALLAARLAVRERGEPRLGHLRGVSDAARSGHHPVARALRRRGTVLDFSLEVELEGRWPWQAQALDRPATAERETRP